jgi:hypothetical protein
VLYVVLNSEKLILYLPLKLTKVARPRLLR